MGEGELGHRDWSTVGLGRSRRIRPGVRCCSALSLVEGVGSVGVDVVEIEHREFISLFATDGHSLTLPVGPTRLHYTPLDPIDDS